MLTVGFLMLAFSIWQSTPPGAFVLFDVVVSLLGGGVVAKTEPEEGASAVLLVLVILSDVEVAIFVYFATQSALLVVGVSALIDATFAVDGHAHPVLLLVPNLPHVHLVLSPYQSALRTHQFIAVDDLTEALVVAEEVQQLLFVHLPGLLDVLLHLL
jgi:hypothetical protein